MTARNKVRLEGLCILESSSAENNLKGTCIWLSVQELLVLQEVSSSFQNWLQLENAEPGESHHIHLCSTGVKCECIQSLKKLERM